ncbi:unnamed protein product [Mytilus coruscus]|uniref:Uncharacterized protein n=1 Tax=Mytilus coruscus TaxID=42192 RepID=A0A6J8E346_MYTCO|nr:unnamed protein product [Mytilus coruscus]
MMLQITTKTTKPKVPMYFEDGLSSAVDTSDRLYLFVCFVSTDNFDLNKAIFVMSSSSVMVKLLKEQVHRVFIDERSVVSMTCDVLDVVVVEVSIVVLNVVVSNPGVDVAILLIDIGSDPKPTSGPSVVQAKKGLNCKLNTVLHSVQLKELWYWQD